MKYGIIGSGSANPKVVQDGLIDVLESDDSAEFVIHARRSPQGAVPDVYDFLVDEEVRFYAVTRIDDNAPNALLNYAMDVTKTEDPVKSILEMCDKVLLLWDESNEESSEKLAIMCADAGKAILDLTMALTPIVIEGSPEPEKVVQETVQVEESVDISPFSREELMNMNIGVLRRQAKAMGVDNVGKTKQEIVDAIFHHEPVETPEVASDVHEAQEPQAMVVYMENGQYMTIQVPLKEIKKLLS
jgi:hypothetical protein